MMKNQTKGETFWRLAWIILRTLFGAIVCLIGVAFWLSVLLLFVAMIGIALGKIPSEDGGWSLVVPVIGAGMLGYLTFGWGRRIIFG